MKHYLLFFYLFAFLPLAVSAQSRFGYLSYSEALQRMPDYATVQDNMSSLREQFAAEMKRAEEDFNKKYEEFLEGQQEFVTSIRKKRQSELQELMEKNLAFKREAQRLLENAEADAMRPLRERLATILNKVGQERGLAFILNTDNNALPWVDPSQGEDLNALVGELLNTAPSGQR